MDYGFFACYLHGCIAIAYSTVLLLLLVLYYSLLATATRISYLVSLMICRKYVKSQKARWGTGTPVHTKTQALSGVRMRKQGSDGRKNQRRLTSGFLFSSLSFYWLIIISILTIFQPMQDKFYLGIR
jgi:hypothetical protein